MRVCLFGGVTVADDVGVAIDIGAKRSQVVLAALALSAGKPVSLGRLVECVWGDDPPRTAERTVQSHISRLRTALEQHGVSLDWASGSYVLRIDPAAVDVCRFEDQLRRGDLDAALAEWSGAPLAGVDAPGLAAVLAGLAERRHGALEAQLGRRIRHGGARDAIGPLTELTVEFPYSEELWALLMLSLYQVGRQADALAAFARARHLLVEELGVEPGPRLQELEAAILSQEISLLDVDPPDVPAVRVEWPPNLPRAATSFVGRSGEISLVSDLLRTSQMVTIAGPGGVGKTRLAIEVAATMAADFADVRFVDLATIDSDVFVDQTVFDAVGAHEVPGRTYRDVLTEALTDRADHRPTLVVLDNCEHVVAGAASISDHLMRATTNVTVLATSQQILRSHGESVFSVPPLVSTSGGDPMEILDIDAGRLFLERARAVAPGYSPTPADVRSIAEIIAHLDGNPLSIELAAARIRMMSATEITQHLVNRFRLLTDGSRALGRQETLLATVAWSYGLMSSEEQAFFDSLSVFSGAFELDGAATVGSAGDLLGVFDLLGQLVDKSLLLVLRSDETTTYRLLETLRLHGSTRLAERGLASETASRHADYVVDLVRDGEARLVGVDQGGWQRRFRAAGPDIRKALEWIIEHRPDESLVAVSGLGPHWYRESATTEGIGWIRRALAAGDPAPTTARANALKWLGALLMMAGQRDEAGDVIAEAVGMARTTGDAHALATSLNAAGGLAFFRGRLDDAIASYQEAVDVQQRAGIAPLPAVLWNLGNAMVDRGDLDGAADVAGRLLAASASDGDLYELAGSVLQCDIAIDRADMVAARERAAHVTRILATMESPILIAAHDDRTAKISLAEHRLDDARRHLDASATVRTAYEAGPQPTHHLLRAQLELDAGNAAAARDALITVPGDVRERQFTWMLARLWFETCRLCIQLDQPAEAAAFFGALVRMTSERGTPIETRIVEAMPDVRSVLDRALGAEPAARNIDRGSGLAVDELFDLVVESLHRR